MGFYDDRILPSIIDRACSIEPVMALREAVVPLAKGRVLEVGMGSGVNLPFYRTEQVEWVWGLEPSQGMRRKAKKNLRQSPVDVHWLDLPGEAIPLDDNSVDTVLLTFTLCTIPDWQTALQQMRRVLKPNGKLLFAEHGLASCQHIQRWQHRITPVWKKFAGGCHLNRDIPDLLQQGGFTIDELQQRYVDKAPKIAGYVYWGEAS